MVTAATRPHVFWVGDHPATQERIRAWPVGEALLATLGEANPDVRDALAAERARLDRHNHGQGLSLPALWWPRRAPVVLVEVAQSPR
jgi:hypothetical protein